MLKYEDREGRGPIGEKREFFEKRLFLEIWRIGNREKSLWSCDQANQSGAVCLMPRAHYGNVQYRQRDRWSGVYQILENWRLRDFG